LLLGQAEYSGQSVESCTKSLETQIIGWLQFHEAMIVLRKTYCPPSGAGSQQTNWEAHNAYHEMCIKLATSQLTLSNAEDDADDEDYEEDKAEAE